MVSLKLKLDRLLMLWYIVLLATSIPSAFDHGAGRGGLIATMVLVGLG